MRLLRQGLLRGLLVVAVMLGLAVALPDAAHGAAPRPRVTVMSAHLNTFTDRLTVRGFAYDPRKPGRAITVRVRTRRHFVKKVRASRPSPTLDRHRGLQHGHRFAVHIPWHRRAHRVRALAIGSHRRKAVDLRHVNYVRPIPGKRIVRVARRYVGKVPYRFGGASPRTGFDCSGFTMWVYRHAHVHRLPHNAEAQHNMPAMHLERRRHARPGDVIFYMSGGAAYHVAIFAGHGWEYAATEPGQKIRHERIWGHNLQFGTTFHRPRR